MDCKTFPDDSSSNKNEKYWTHHQFLKLPALFQGPPVAWPLLPPVRPSTDTRVMSINSNCHRRNHNDLPAVHRAEEPAATHAPLRSATQLEIINPHWGPTQFPMGTALFFLSSLRTVAKQNQLARFRMASTAAAANTVRFPHSFWSTFRALTSLLQPSSG